MALNLHLMRIFAGVVEAQSFTRAAIQLFISQPAVSKAVQELERQVGLPLIERGAGGAFRLTEAGERLYAHARTILATERAAEEDLAALRGLERGTLKVGASTTIATYLLPPLLGAFRAHHAGIEVILTSANTQEIADRVVDYQLDVALVEGPVADPRIEARPWRTDELVVIAAANHPLADQQPVSPQALREEAFITREPGSGTRDVAEQALAACDLQPRIALELGSTEAIKQAVAAGLGVAIVSRAALADQLALGKLKILTLPELLIRRELNELRRAGRVPSAAARAFAPFLRPEGAAP
jgi:DNA-binding transcriptional LysR family regulator